MTRPRVLFLGQKPFGEAAWERLREDGGGAVEVAAVVTNFSADAAGVWWGSRRIADTAAGMPVIDNAERNEAALAEVILRYHIDLILCVQHPWVLSPVVLKLVDYRALNFHNAALPRYRGYNAVNHALLDRADRFTCTVHWMADEVDAGDMALECSFPIDPAETALSLYAKAHHAGLRLFDEVLAHLRDGRELPRRSMSAGGCFYGRRSIDRLREIRDPASPELALKARAFFFPPFEPAYVIAGGRCHYVLPPEAWTGGGEGRSLLDATIRRVGAHLDLCLE